MTCKLFINIRFKNYTLIIVEYSNDYDLLSNFSTTGSVVLIISYHAPSSCVDGEQKTILCSPSPLASSPYTVSGVFEEKVLVNRIECVPSLDCVYAALD
jgi:hypothetical protein